MNPKFPSCFILSALALTSASLHAESLVLNAGEDTRIAAVCGSTIHDFTAVVNKPDVTVETGEGAEIKSATVRMKFAEVRTGDEDRDKDMRKRFNAEANPDITYVVKSFEKTKEGTLTAKGALTWNGVTKELNVPVTVKREGDSLTVDAAFTLDHRDWGLKKVRSMLMLTVDPELKFTVALRGKLRPAPAVTPAKAEVK